MRADIDAADTPYYVLTDGSRWMRPQIAESTSEAFVYGFSGKGPYDSFCANCDLILKPYPLVKGYLRNQVGAACATFIVIDADGPAQSHLHAATVQAVLEAQENRASRVAIVRRLIFDKEANVYRKPFEDQE